MYKETIDKLAIYNAQLSQGIKHTDGYKDEMRKLQSLFDQELLHEAKRKGYKWAG